MTSEEAVDALKKDLQDAIAKEGEYITPERCKEVILGVLKMHTDAGNILPLAACPFCGGEALLTTAMGESWVKCKICNASAGMRGSVDRAIAAWNTRP